MRKLLTVSILFNLLFICGIVYALVKIGSPRYLFYLVKYRGNGIVSLKKHRTSHLATLPKDTGKIVMLGNSITAECEWRDLLGNPNVVNRGIIGDGVDDILARLSDVTATQPNKIFLLNGVNDIAFQPLDSIAEKYESIVSTIRRDCPNTVLFCESVLPINNSLRRNGMKNEDIRALNLKIQAIAQRHNATYIDVHAQFVDGEGALKEQFSLDGVHLNGEGYLLMKKTLLPFVNN
jgi:lysophospholipase L1-like esterase